MTVLPAPLAPLAAYRQFILRDGKLPVDYRTALVCSAHDPAVWLDAETAIATARAYGPRYGIGFVFAESDPFFFTDIDNCLLPDGTGWSPVALDVLGRLPGAAVEISQSGRGLHVIARGVVPVHACKNTTYGLEFYTKERFVALTGTGAVGSAATDLNGYLPGLVASYFPPTVLSAEGWTTEPDPEWRGPEDDAELLEKALKSKSGTAKFGDRASFKQLWEADPVALGKAFPDPGGLRPYDESSADASLAQHLAFWTGKNCERILRMMKGTALTREKWEREDYLPRTIERAVAMQKNVYQAPQALGILTELPTDGPQIVAGWQYMPAHLQLEHFKGCTYVQDMHRIFTPKGTLLKKEQFDATFGGYVFQIDDTGKTTTRKAWDAFTESQTVRYPKAEASCFRPNVPAGALIEEEGRVLVNTYVPIEIAQTPGDPTPFITHLSKVLPNPQDQGILLAYMAACIQHKGVKFQWAPLLQGVEGNGKTLFTRCVAAGIGKRYTHYPKADDLANKFNGWLLNKLLIGVEDIYVPAHRREVLETLKPMITGGDGLEIQMKGVDQVTADICANFLLNSNHKDAILKTKNDRRFAVFYTAQQTAEDLVRDGMSGAYFPDIYKWLNGGGYAVVTDYLARYQIPDALNPATNCHRAPTTSSTSEVLVSSLGAIEQEIMEAINEGRPGFAGGWVSSHAVNTLLQNMGSARSIPHNKRRELLQDLGYDWHPGLSGGRVNNPLAVDGFRKPRLFIQNGHLSTGLAGGGAIAEAYVKAQTQAVAPGVTVPMPEAQSGP